MKKLLKEPLVHFLVLGLALFALFGAVSDDSGATEGVITISEGELVRLSTTFQRQWRRPPTEDELAGLVEALIREEVLYREALGLGLERDDTIIRRRLAQKIEFLSEDLASRIEPGEDDLKKFFDENPELYELAPELSFSHIYFNEDSRSDATADAAAVLARLETTAPLPERAPELGDRFMLQYDYIDMSESQIARHFGGQFAETVMGLENGWQGPIRSGYGMHLVNIHGREPASMPEFEEVRDRVGTDFSSDLREKANEAFYSGLRDRYVVVVEEEWLRGRIEGSVPGNGSS